MTEKILVGIANHGTGSQSYLDRLLEAYRQSPWPVDVVILSNIPKDLGPDVKVRVGVPSRNPFSLPFAHRTLFRESLDQYDLFIYSEDDTLVSPRNLKAFEWATGVLRPDEIAGFLRSETGPDGQISYSTCHACFRWKPGSVCERGGCLWAEFSNDHSACFMATRSQLRQAIASGGFPVEPHEGRYDMREAAATDIYTGCGLRRLICLDRLGEFTLPHLPNKYIGKMGLRGDLMDLQVEMLRAIHCGELPAYELLDPETRLPGSRGSKRYDERSDEVLESLLPADGGRLLSWGCGGGDLEAGMIARGWRVTGVPLDAVIGAVARHRGVELVYGPGERALHQVQAERFDAVLCSDVCHLIDDPQPLVDALAACLRPGGVFMARVPNFSHAMMLKSRLRDRRYPRAWNRATIGAWPLSPRRLLAIARNAGLERAHVTYAVPERHARLSRALAGSPDRWLSPYLYVQAVRR